MVNQGVKQSSENQSGFFYGYVVVAVAFFIMVIMVGITNTFGVFLKPLINELHWSRGVLSGALSLCVITRGVLGIVMGGLSDKYGSRRVLTFCSVLMGLGYLLLSQVSAIWQIYLFYGILVGIGLSGVFSPLFSTVIRWFVTRRSMMTGIVIAGAGTGTMIMPLIINQLIAIYGWRISVGILGGVIIVLVVLAAQFLKRDPSQVGQVAYGADRGGESRLRSEVGSFSLKQATHKKQLWIVCSSFLCLGVCMMVIIVHIVPHATDLGISAAGAATILAAVGGLSIPGRLVMGVAGDKIGNRRVFLIGFFLILVSLIWLMQATEAWAFYVFAVVFGFAYGGCTAVLSPLVAELFGPASHGAIFGLTDFSWAIGGAFGPFIAGYVFDLTGSYQLAFSLCVALSILALALIWLLKPIYDR